MSSGADVGPPGMTQYLLTVPHDSTEEPTTETMDPAELEAALAVTGAIIEELTSTGAFVLAGAGGSQVLARCTDRRPIHRGVDAR